jgi:hypothetical protein
LIEVGSSSIKFLSTSFSSSLSAVELEDGNGGVGDGICGLGMGVIGVTLGMRDLEGVGAWSGIITTCSD